MIDESGYISILDSELESTIKKHQSEGWRVFRLPANMSSKDEFFNGVRLTLPLDPPLYSNRSWDALADSLWAGLDGLPDRNIVIVWPSTSRFEMYSVDDFAIAQSILADLPVLLSNNEVTAGSITNVVVLHTS